MEDSNKHIPQLRFPGFTGEWEEKKLGDFFELRNGYAFRSDSYLENGKYKIITIANVQSGKLDLSKFNALSVIPDNLADYQKLKEGDILVSMTGNVGRVCMVDRPNCLLNQRVGLLEQRNQNIDKKYVYHLINSSQFEEAMIKSAQGAAQANISKDNIEHFPIVLPPSPYEQQKIADCLSSLDDMISAEGQKTEALREYKRGLMQQLFPANGATTPQLRFPGFIGEWKEKKLGEIGNVCMCKRIMKDETNSQQGIPFYKIGTFGSIADSFISEELYHKYKDKYSFPKKGEILLSAAGTIGKVVVYDGKPAYFQDSNIVWINNDEREVLNCFLKYIYSTITWKTDNGGVVLRLYNESIRSQQIIIPPSLAEQQKIAECLYSLDDMISAQAQKTETLREYKRGLMQQLFPQPSKLYPLWQTTTTSFRNCAIVSQS